MPLRACWQLVSPYCVNITSGLPHGETLRCLNTLLLGAQVTLVGIL